MFTQSVNSIRGDRLIVKGTYLHVSTIMLWVAGGICTTQLYNRHRDDRLTGMENDLTYLTLLVHFHGFGTK